jgi:hypothetical protein
LLGAGVDAGDGDVAPTVGDLMATGLQLDRIQGNIAPGFRKDHQAFLLVRFPEGPSARDWLEAFRPDVSSAREVATFNQLFKLVRERRPGEEHHAVRAIWANVAFSCQGLKRLSAGSAALDAEIETFPDTYKGGLIGAAGWLRDGDAETIAKWEVGGTPETEPHALVVLAADAADDLSRELRQQVERLASFGVERLTIYPGQVLRRDLGAYEHFGFRDGVS